MQYKDLLMFNNNSQLTNVNNKRWEVNWEGLVGILGSMKGLITIIDEHKLKKIYLRVQILALRMKTYRFKEEIHRDCFKEWIELWGINRPQVQSCSSRHGEVNKGTRPNNWLKIFSDLIIHQLDKDKDQGKGKR